MPIINLTAVVRDLYEFADQARERRAAALAHASQEAALAAYLEDLAAHLAGTRRG